MKSETNKYGTVLSLSVKFIKNKYSAILFCDGKLHSQMLCENKKDIGYICRELLRWYDKMGGISDWAKSARYRQHQNPIGKIYYNVHLRK